MNILIAEDTEDSRVMLEMALVGQGYEVMSGANGIEALSLARTNPPDLIISDIMMPEMDGFELCRQLKADPKLLKIPFIFYTATYTEKQDEELAMALGASHFIIKPMEPQAFMEIIQEVLAASRADELAVPHEPQKEEAEIDRMYRHALARKLDKKVGELEQRRAELQKSEEKFRTIFESSSDAIMLLDDVGFFDCNGATLKIFGCETREDFLDRHPAQWSPAMQADGRNSREAAEENNAAAYREGRHFFEWTYVRANEEQFPAEVLLTPLSLGGKTVLQATVRDITERKRVEEKLRKNEKQLSEAQQIAHLGSWELDLVSDELSWSDELFRIFEIESPDAVTSYKTFLEAIHPEDRELVNKTYNDSVRDRTPYDIEHRILLKDGGIKYVNERCETTYDDNGKPLRSLGTALDITELKKTQRKLEHERLHLRNLLEATPDIVCFKDYEGRWVDANRAHLELFQLQGVAFHGKTNLELAPLANPIYREAFETCVLSDNQAWNAGHLIQTEESIPTPKGPSSIFDILKIPLFNDSGEPEALLMVGRDITERKRMEEQLRKLAQAVEQSSESIFITNLDAEIEYVNEAFVRTSGYSPEELLGQNPRILQSGKTPPETYTALWAALTHGRAWKGEFSNRRKDGTDFDESAIISPIRQPDGSVTHYVGVKEDVTEKKLLARELDNHRHHLEELVEERTVQLAEARERADAANRAKSMFLATMSHEIRTPMNGVVGMLELLFNTKLDSRQQNMARIAKESAGALLQIINDILDFSKVEAGKMELEKAPVNLIEVIEGVAQTFRPQASQKGLRLCTAIDPDIPDWILGDTGRLRQLLVNFTSNAVKFTESTDQKKGHICLVAKLLHAGPDDEVIIRLAVKDNGIGMSEETVAKLFQPFTQADGATTRKYGGTGLGLSICSRFTELMNGTLSVDSTPEGGSEFTVDLPTAVAESPKGDETGYDFSGVQLLLAIEELCYEQELLRHLEKWGINCVVCTKPTEVVSEAEKAVDEGRGYNVFAIWDDFGGSLQMKICDELRSHERLAETPIILLDEHLNGLRIGNTLNVQSNPILLGDLRSAIAVATGLESPRTVVGEIPAGARIDTPTIAQAEGEGRLVLVAEDNPINQEVIRDQLNMLGYAVEIAKDGVEALSMLKTGRFSLLLSDCHMPRMDGYELSRTIREEESGAAERFTIIAVTASALKGDREKCLAAGMDDYVSKPVELAALKEVMNRWMPFEEEGEKIDSQPDVAKGSAKARGEGGPIDPLALTELVGDDPDRHLKFLRKFAALLPEAVGDIVKALGEGNMEQLASLTHKLKSSSKAMGAHELSSVCEALEQQGNADKIKDAQKLGAKLPELMEEILNYVKALWMAEEN